MDLNKKLEELKPYQLNCNVFDVYSYNGLTMQDLLCQFFTKINECITVSNETIDLAKWLVNEGLEIEVVKKLMIWLEDGTLENIINVNLFNTLNDKINGLSSQLEHNMSIIDNRFNTIVDNNINNNFIKGTSFFCHTDEDTRKYLLNQPSRIENYKKCGIEEVFLYLIAIFDGNNISTNISSSVLLEASNILKNNGFKVGIKVNDVGVDKINSDNHEKWFSEKTRILKEVCSVIGNPTQINIANENPITNVVEYRSGWEKLVSELRVSYPNTLLSVHTYFSDYYHGKIVVADLVDLLGINYYPYTSDKKVPTTEEVKKAIYRPINGDPFLDTMNEYCERYNKKFIISEWGTASFEYQCKNPSIDWIPQSEKVLNPDVQSIFMSEACRLFPYMENCYGMYLWSSNCYRNLNTNFEKSWAWDESEITINAIANVWG